MPQPCFSTSAITNAFRHRFVSRAFISGDDMLYIVITMMHYERIADAADMISLRMIWFDIAADAALREFRFLFAELTDAPMVPPDFHIRYRAYYFRLR